MVPDPLQRAMIEVTIIPPETGPALAPARETTTRRGVRDAVAAVPVPVPVPGPVTRRKHPLVVISHGNGGYPEAHLSLARELAAAGMMTALVRHPGNNDLDNHLANTLACVAGRPRHLDRAIRAILAHPRFASAVDPRRIALAGHSLGGYTALALAGGQPVTTDRETPGGPYHPFAVPHRPVQALVLLAPATMWFPTPAHLAAITTPVFIRTGGRDLVTPDAAADIVRAGVASPRPLDDKIISAAGHFDFMDRPKHDHAPKTVLTEVNTAVTAFLQRILRAPDEFRAP